MLFEDQELKDCVAVRSDESGGECATTTIPDNIVKKLRKLNVGVLGEGRPLAFPDIRYGDEPWNILKES